MLSYHKLWGCSTISACLDELRSCSLNMYADVELLGLITIFVVHCNHSMTLVLFTGLCIGRWDADVLLGIIWSQGWINKISCGLEATALSAWLNSVCVSQVFPLRWAVPSPPLTLWGEAIPVSCVWEEVCPQWSPVKAHQSPSFSQEQPNSPHCCLIPPQLHSLNHKITIH